MRNDREYEIYKAISTYLKLRKVLFHFDYAGMHHTKAQAGKMKAIQGAKGWPDLFIAEPRGGYNGLFIEIKKEGEKIRKKDNTAVSEHIREQSLTINALAGMGYYSCFCVGFDNLKKVIDQYLSWK